MASRIDMCVVWGLYVWGGCGKGVVCGGGGMGVGGYVLGCVWWGVCGGVCSGVGVMWLDGSMAVDFVSFSFRISRMGMNEKMSTLSSFGKSDNREKGPFGHIPYLFMINYHLPLSLPSLRVPWCDVHPLLEHLVVPLLSLLEEGVPSPLPHPYLLRDPPLCPLQGLHLVRSKEEPALQHRYGTSLFGMLSTQGVYLGVWKEGERVLHG